MTLFELTRQESGIVVYGEGPGAEAFVCNWTGINGLPRIAPGGMGIIGLGEDLPAMESGAGEAYDYMSPHQIIYADATYEPPCECRVWRFPQYDAVVLAPLDWD